MNFSKVTIFYFLTFFIYSVLATQDDSNYGDDYYNDLDEYYTEEHDENDKSSYRCPGTFKMVSLDFLCDDFADCEDESDEDVMVCAEYLPTTSTVPPPTTTPLSTTSTIRTTTTTILNKLRMMEKEDQDYSEYGECMEDEFQCSLDIGLCIPMISVCDGVSDCSDGSDEARCGRHHKRKRLHKPTEEPIIRMAGEELSRITFNTVHRRPVLLPRIVKNSQANAYNFQDSRADTKTPLRRPVIITKPPKIQHAPIPTNPKFIQLKPELDIAKFEAVQRVMPEVQVSEEHDNAQRYINEMSDHEAESLLQKLTSNGLNDQIEDVVTSPTTAESTTTTTTTIIPSSSAQPSGPKRQKKKFKGILGQMMRQMSKLASSDLDNRDIDINIKIGSIVNEPSSDSTSSENTNNKRREPRLRFSLEMSL